MSFEVIKESSKMKMLNLLKDTPGKETYLTKVTNTKHRIAMTKLRLSGHRLAIETGRYSKDTAAEDRLCSYCKFHGQTAVEDEIHFLTKCPMSKEFRENILLSHILKDTEMTEKEKFISLMSDSETNDLRKTAKFIHQALEEREIKLDVLHTLTELVLSVEKLVDKTDPGEDTKIQPRKNRKKSEERYPIYKIKDFCQKGLKMTLSRATDNYSR